MPLKPIRSGYKIWCPNLEGGYLFNFEKYQGKRSKNEFSNQFGLGPNLVHGLIKPLPSGNFSVFIDNYCNSITLLKHLKSKEIGCTSTIKGSTLQDCPLPSKNGSTKKPKGSSAGYFDSSTGINLSYGMTMGQLLWDQTSKVLGH